MAGFEFRHLPTQVADGKDPRQVPFPGESLSTNIYATPCHIILNEFVPSAEIRFSSINPLSSSTYVSRRVIQPDDTSVKSIFQKQLREVFLEASCAFLFINREHAKESERRQGEEEEERRNRKRQREAEALNEIRVVIYLACQI